MDDNAKCFIKIKKGLSNEKKKAYRKSWYKSLHFLIWLKRKKQEVYVRCKILKKKE